MVVVVRNPALRSAGAAKEIKALIIDSVESGQRQQLVGQAGTNMALELGAVDFIAKPRLGIAQGLAEAVQLGAVEQVVPLAALGERLMALVRQRGADVRV